MRVAAVLPCDGDLLLLHGVCAGDACCFWKGDVMSEHWKTYATDFNAMTDAEIEAETERARSEVEELEDWLEAVASWEAAGKPRA
jgi:hypothetical protein